MTADAARGASRLRCRHAYADAAAFASAADFSRCHDATPIFQRYAIIFATLVFASSLIAAIRRPRHAARGARCAAMRDAPAMIAEITRAAQRAFRARAAHACAPTMRGAAML